MYDRHGQKQSKINLCEANIETEMYDGKRQTLKYTIHETFVNDSCPTRESRCGNQ
jgi:hypothetical protein